MKPINNFEETEALSAREQTSLLHYFSEDEIESGLHKQIMQKYPAKVTPYIYELSKRSEAIRKQFFPAPEEMESNGTSNPFEEGKESSKTYGLERLYRDRVLITPHFDCPAYCRFCYKKSRVMRNHHSMSIEDIDTAVEEVSKMSEVRAVLITGGEPFLDVEKLFYLLDKVFDLPNIHEVRIGTRSLLTMPHIHTDELAERLASYNRPDFNNAENSKYLAINVHFNHPDELQPEVLKACYKLTSRGITLRDQTVLLKGINDNIYTMKKLFQLLLRNNIIVYYMNHCMPVEGSDHLRTSVEKGLVIFKELCTESSTAIPHYVFAPKGGKVHLGPDSELDYTLLNDIKHLNVKLLYKAEEFKRISKKDLPPLHSATSDGFIKGVYMDGNDDI